MENGFAEQCAGIQSNNYSTALSIVCLGKPNTAKANFNSSLLKPLSASWLAESQERERERRGERDRGKCPGRGDRKGQEARCMRG